MKIIGVLTSTVIALVYASIMNGWALTKLWVWFVVPVFHLPVLNIPQAIGIALVIGYLTMPTSKTEKDDDEYWLVLVKAIALTTFKPLFCLAVGAIVRAFL